MATLAHFVPEIWSGRVLARLEKALVYRNVCTTEYEGEITGAGSVVKINEIGPISVNTYSATSTGALTVEQLTDAQKLLKIDQMKYFAFWLDDTDNARTTPKLMREAMDGGAYAIANNIDYYVSRLYPEANLIVGGGTSSNGVDISSTNVLKYLALCQQKLDEANTPAMGRWIVVPPWFAQKMTLSRIALDTSNSEALMTGFIGRTHYGFDVFVSNQVRHSSGTTAAAILCGYRGSIALAVQYLATRQESSGTIGFKTLVKGLVVYGAKVIRPNNLAVLYADYVAEAT